MPGVCEYSRGPLISVQNSRRPQLWPAGKSYLWRDIPVATFPCTAAQTFIFSLQGRLSHSRQAMLLCQSVVALIRACHQCSPWAVFATSRGLIPAACQHLTGQQHLIVRVKGRSSHTRLSPARAFGSSPGECVLQMHPMNISMLSVNALWIYYGFKRNTEHVLSHH